MIQTEMGEDRIRRITRRRSSLPCICVSGTA